MLKNSYRPTFSALTSANQGMALLIDFLLPYLIFISQGGFSTIILILLLALCVESQFSPSFKKQEEIGCVSEGQFKVGLVI